MEGGRLTGSTMHTECRELWVHAATRAWKRAQMLAFAQFDLVAVRVARERCLMSPWAVEGGGSTGTTMCTECQELGVHAATMAW